ncbi:MAG: hypothetical protein A2X86_11990 [Bdellovibrionales bacterium GWA2_49_15]|nr:MAG: hypothetical protein A2X86_11990 [Bdellovibrionales bacterium GWA2_49_15]
MNVNILQEMLLIEEKSIFNLYKEMMQIAGYFVAPVFTIGLILEYFGQMNFGAVVIKLFIITMFMSAFYEIHTAGVKLSLKTASITLQKVSPRNLFVKKWTTAKMKTTEKRDWNFIQSFAIPNLNDLIATIFFVLSKAFIWLLKLIYSSVYHLTYVFSGITAILYFLGWTKDSLKGTVQASLWCMALPFVIVAILALVGNSIDESAISGEFVLAKMDTIIWLFGVTLLLLISPMITYAMVKGEGIHSFGAKMGSMVVGSGIKAMTLYPMFAGGIKTATQGMSRVGSNALIEPSIKELLQKENAPDKSKMKLLEKKGGIKSPLSTGRSLDERLNAVGMTKDEAQTLSKMPVSQAQNSGTGSIFKKVPNSNSGNRPLKREKQSFQFDKKYWESITPEHREGIKKKYGIEGNNTSKNKIHYPLHSGRPSVTVSTPIKMTDAPNSHPKKGGLNELQ